MALAAYEIISGVDRPPSAPNDCSPPAISTAKRVGVVCKPGFGRPTTTGTSRITLASYPGARSSPHYFGPQHGFRSDVQENMIEDRGTVETTSGRVAGVLRSTVTLATRPQRCCANLDVLVIDLQDVGTRIYTYIYTMANCLVAARKHGVKVIVCDSSQTRSTAPRSRGRCSSQAFESFVGLYPIPIASWHDDRRELARLFNEHFGIGADLEVVAMEGWRREMYLDEARAPWGHAVTEHADARVGDCVSRYGAVRRNQRFQRGAGTTRPFELIGAPGIVAETIRGGSESAPPCRGAYFSSRRVRADLPQTCPAVLRWLPGFMSSIDGNSGRC